MAKVMVIGSGAREHALAETFLRSTEVEEVIVVPGNAGMQSAGIRTVDHDMMDVVGLRNLAQQEVVDLTFVGSEAPLIAGVVDVFQTAGLKIFGPTQQAAQLEGSKQFAKDVMAEAGVPTATSVMVTDESSALQALKNFDLPLVIKQDGLAAGKGVVICRDREDAETMIQLAYERQADAPLVIESYMAGVEFSIFSLVGPNGVIHAPIAQDHKRRFDNDQGLNTGGMGAYSPVRWVSDEIVQEAIQTLVLPTLATMAARAMPFTGVLYTGVMLTDDGPKVVEYNVRFGDPEAQVVLPQLQSDFYELISTLLAGEQPQAIWQQDDVYVGVVLVNPSYPATTTEHIDLPSFSIADINTFYAGVTRNDDKLISNGGRIATVVGHAATASQAQEMVYEAIDATQTTLAYRHDIGYQAVREENKVVSGDAN
ncbi:phosphoribosylamine--glycine ligase [Weissella confusa]|uniref:phosphoribosylamine--glycine ligase n=1 Tax=Weissella confusa TaxID=1583 RepID=UPI0035A29262